jgi:hypothetical protein
MLDNWRERSNLRRRIKHYNHLLAEGEGRVGLQSEVRSLKVRLDELETERLIGKAQRLGIEIPKKEGWWWDDLDYVSSPDDVSFYLTDVGKAGVSKLIREERKKSIEWWIKTIIVPLITALISVLSLIVALVSVSSK